MREEDWSWFSKWEEELPSPEELTPLSQTLISRDLAAAFDIQPTGNFRSGGHQMSHHRIHHHRSSGAPPPSHQPTSGDFDSSSAELGGGGGSEEPARTLKRPRLVWTPQLHKRFVDAVAHLGIRNAVPKTIMQLMSVDGLTRENVASHLQKYRLYLKRMQGIHTGSAAGSGGGSGDSATDHLFASSPVPAHFLQPQGGGSGGGGRSNSERFLGYGPPAAIQQQQQQVAAMVAVTPYHQQQHHRQMGQFEHPFLSRQAQINGARLGLQNSVAGFREDIDSRSPATGKNALTLFPNGDI